VAPTSRSHSPSARALYETRCVRCHEPDGKARELHESIPHAPDFTDPHWHENRTTAQLIVSILDGKGKQMPAFGGKLTTSEARDLVAYLRTFAPSSPTASEAAPDDFETRFRELEEEFQRLKEQLDELAPRRKR
jgi:mono/diheme cytochrome c family protein